MRDYNIELKNRITFIRECISSANTDGIIYGNSGGKDSALVGILCKMACDNTVGLVMPCGSKRNYIEDKNDAETVAKQYGIETRFVDLSNVKNELTYVVNKITNMTDASLANIAPRLRMTALYSVAASENRLVAGTGNRSEGYMGYFTKWGDGAYDFNPIADLTVTEIYEFLSFLKAPECIIYKTPSAGLFDGQTDENEMGVTYKSIDAFLFDGIGNENDINIIKKYHEASEHKRKMPIVYGNKGGQ